MTDARQQPIDSGFGARSEPAEVLAGVDLTGRTAIVTGGYSGIGLETVRALSNAGATITVPARSVDHARDTLADIDRVTVAPMDLADIASVQSFTAAWLGRNSVLDLLINNAGIMACPLTRVGPGWEAQFGTNHMGHFALATGLMGALRSAAAPRVVALTSIGHIRSGVNFDDIQFGDTAYDKWQAYGQSKTANALFARGLNARLADAGGLAFSVHPGGIFTPLQRHLATEEMQAMGWLGEDGKPSEVALARFKTPTQGASTTLWAATTDRLGDHGGVYCEDCDVAQGTPADSAEMSGVRPHAMDDGLAERLWEVSEALLAGA